MYLRLIPKLDIKNENLVKGIHLEGLRVLGNPREFALKYYEEGADEIIYHDVVASLYKRNNISKLIEKTSENIFIPLLAGGGITNLAEVEKILKSGADRIFINTAAIDNLKFINEIVRNYGSSTIVLSVEVLKINNKYLCRKDFGREETNIELVSWIKEAENLGVGEVLVTSIDTDGTGLGFDLKIGELLSKNIYIPFILNGGFSKLSHFSDVLNSCSPAGFAIGSMLHYSYMSKINLINSKIDGNTNFLKKNIKYSNFNSITISDIKNHISKKFNYKFRN